MGWIGALVYNLNWKIGNPSNGKVQTDGKCIIVDKSFISDPNFTYYVYANVISASLAHPERMGVREPKLWNVACAHVVHHMMDQLNIFKRVKVPIVVCDLSKDPLNFPTDKTVEKIYEMLLAMSEESIQEIQNPNNIIKPNQKVNPVDVNQKLMDFKHVVDSIPGTEPGNMDYLIGLGQSYVHWQRYLHQYFQACAPVHYSYRKPNASLWAEGFFAPTLSRSMNTFAFVMDTSGSVGDDDISKFMAEAFRAAKTTGSRIILLCMDSEVYVDKIRIIEPNDFVPATLEITGRGGTCYTPALRWLKHQKDYHIVASFFFTDGYGDDPPVQESPQHPVFWFYTETVPAKWGNHVKYDKYADDR